MRGGVGVLRWRVQGDYPGYSEAGGHRRGPGQPPVARTAPTASGSPLTPPCLLRIVFAHVVICTPCVSRSTCGGAVGHCQVAPVAERDRQDRRVRQCRAKIAHLPRDCCHVASPCLDHDFCAASCERPSMTLMYVHTTFSATVPFCHSTCQPAGLWRLRH